MESKKVIGLGYGLTNVLEDISSVQQEISNISLEYIQSSKFQPRKDFDQESIQRLAISIKDQGILQPIILRKLNNKSFEIIAGERRWRAAKVAGLTTIPSIVKEVDDKSASAIALIENLQRKDLNVIEEALAYKNLFLDYSMTQEGISKHVGKARSTITNILRLLDLAVDVKNLLKENLLEVGHAKLLLTLSQEQQIEIAKVIVEKKLSVRESEKLIHNLKNSEGQNIQVSQFIDPRIDTWTKTLSNKLHSNVKINLGKQGRVAVRLNLNSIDEIEWLVKKIENL